MHKPCIIGLVAVQTCAIIGSTELGPFNWHVLQCHLEQCYQKGVLQNNNQGKFVLPTHSISPNTQPICGPSRILSIHPPHTSPYQPKHCRHTMPSYVTRKIGPPKVESEECDEKARPWVRTPTCSTLAPLLTDCRHKHMSICTCMYAATSTCCVFLMWPRSLNPLLACL